MWIRYRYCPDITSMLYRYCLDTVAILYRYCIDVVYRTAYRNTYFTVYSTVYLRWPVVSWGLPPPPEPVQALAVACGEENAAFRHVVRVLTMRFAKFITPMADASACGGLCDSWRRGGHGGLKVNFIFNPLAKLHPVIGKSLNLWQVHFLE